MTKKKSFSFIKFFLFIVFICGGTFLYGYYVEPKLVKVNEYKIDNENISKNFDGFTIVHLSDVHYNENFDLTDLSNVISTINDISPDIVVLSGDLIDKRFKLSSTEAEKISNELAKIEALCGKYAISGDEDIKFDEWDNIINDSGFINLNNNYDTIYKNGYDSIVVAGVSSFKDKESIINKNQKTENYLNSFEKGGPVYKILVMHEPDYIDELENNPYNLVLAGHSLGGYVNLPFIGPVIIKDGAKKYSDGKYSNSYDLFVSTGLGTSDIHYRLFNTPSINVYRLLKN